jgi:hypothetical protein
MLVAFYIAVRRALAGADMRAVPVASDRSNTQTAFGIAITLTHSD